MCYNVKYRKIGLRGDKVADKKRIVWIDQLRGLAFYFVVLGHMAVSGDFEAWIYSFHMPLFFIISGFNLNFDRMKETGFKDYISHIVVRMLVPYLWLQFIALGLKYAISGGLIRVPKYLLGMAVAGIVGYFSIRLVNLLAAKGKFGAFAYYCWGAGALFLILSLVL